MDDHEQTLGDADDPAQREMLERLRKMGVGGNATADDLADVQAVYELVGEVTMARGRAIEIVAGLLKRHGAETAADLHAMDVVSPVFFEAVEAIISDPDSTRDAQGRFEIQTRTRREEES